jgi:hypothetical protein
MPDSPTTNGPSGHPSGSVEEAADEGPLPGPEMADEDAARQEDQEDRTDLGVIPNDGNDLDPDRNPDPGERIEDVAGDDTVGGIHQH